MTFLIPFFHSLFEPFDLQPRSPTPDERFPFFFQISVVSLKSGRSLSCLDRRMASKDDGEFDALAPDNSLVWTPDTSGLEGTADRLEQVMKNMEELLLDVEQLRSECSLQASELVRAAGDLRQQQEELKESYADLSRDMQEIMESFEELFSSRSDSASTVEQADKLNQQPTGKESD